MRLDGADIPGRAVFYFQLGFSGAALLLVALCPETYAPSILRAKAKRLRRETGDDRYKSQAEMADTSLAHDLLQSTTIPFKLLAAEPMALVLDLWCAFVLGVRFCSCFASADDAGPVPLLRARDHANRLTSRTRSAWSSSRMASRNIKLASLLSASSSA